jgi:predicted nucleotidyltransferase
MPNMGIVIPKMGIKKFESASRGGASGRRPAKLPAAPGIADTLFSGTQQKVLALLFGQAGRSLLASEIIARAGCGSGAVQRELARLTASGLVLVERVGRQTHYRANESSPVFAELVALVRKTVGLVDPLRSALLPLAGRIHAALIYGSVARGEAKADSDIDLLVVSDELQLEDLYRVLAAVEQALSRPIHPTMLKTDEFDRRRSQSGSFVRRVLKAPVEWLIGGPDADSGAR